MTLIGTRLRSAALVSGVMASALCFYMVSLRVSAERAAVNELEHRIAGDMGTIRQLQSELGTRERLPQLEKWNADVLAMSAPKPGQYLNGAVELAAFANDRQPDSQPSVQQAIAVAQPRPAEVQTVAYDTDEAPATRRPAAAQPVVTFAAAHDDSQSQPLLQAVSFHPKPSRPVSVNVAASASLLSDGLMTELRDAAEVEASGLRKARR